jgi:hypothetical protein
MNDVQTNTFNLPPIKYHSLNRACIDNDDCTSPSESQISEMDHRDMLSFVDVGIYRYKFSNLFIEELFRFSKIHEYDDRKTFKEEWTTWTEENDDLIQVEIRRLQQLGYDGDILNKMFKSARYYFRKKNPKKKAQVKRRTYIGLQKEMIEAMDDYINLNVSVKPSESFAGFCKSHEDLLKKQVVELCKCNIKDPEEIREKVKKTYKNRYFIKTKNK